MDLAHVIKGLLNIECMFRFVGFVLTNSLRGAFILWGWQPDFLLKIIGYMDWLTRENKLDEMSWNSTNNDNLTYHIYNLSKTSTTEHANIQTLYPSVELVCLLPSSLAIFCNYGITIFVLLTGVVRY